MLRLPLPHSPAVHRGRAVVHRAMMMIVIVIVTVIVIMMMSVASVDRVVVLDRVAVAPVAAQILVPSDRRLREVVQLGPLGQAEVGRLLVLLLLAMQQPGGGGGGRRRQVARLVLGHHHDPALLVLLLLLPLGGGGRGLGRGRHRLPVVVVVAARERAPRFLSDPGERGRRDDASAPPLAHPPLLEGEGSVLVVGGRPGPGLGRRLQVEVLEVEAAERGRGAEVGRGREQGEGAEGQVVEARCGDGEADLGREDERVRHGRAAVVRRDLSTQVWRVQFRVRVGAVPVPRPPRAEHHAAPLHRALVHLAQMDRAEVDLQRPFVAERLQAHVALHPLLARGRVDERGAQVRRYVPGRAPLAPARSLAGRVGLPARDTRRPAQRSRLKRKGRMVSVPCVRGTHRPSMMLLMLLMLLLLLLTVPSAQVERAVRVLVVLLVLLGAELAALLAAAVRVRGRGAGDGRGDERGRGLGRGREVRGEGGRQGARGHRDREGVAEVEGGGGDGGDGRDVGPLQLAWGVVVVVRVEMGRAVRALGVPRGLAALVHALLGRRGRRRRRRRGRGWGRGRRRRGRNGGEGGEAEGAQLAEVERLHALEPVQRRHGEMGVERHAGGGRVGGGGHPRGGRGGVVVLLGGRRHGWMRDGGGRWRWRRRRRRKGRRQPRAGGREAAVEEVERRW